MIETVYLVWFFAGCAVGSAMGTIFTILFRGG